MKLPVATHIMFKRILCPTDFSKSSDEAVSTALEIASLLKCELIVLYAYRLVLNDDKRDNLNKVLFKREQEAMAEKKFQGLRQACPGFSGIECTFLSEVGFVSERISSTISTSHIDLLVLSSSIQRKLKEQGGDDEGELSLYFRCPVLLVPSPELVSKAHK